MGQMVTGDERRREIKGERGTELKEKISEGRGR